MVKATFFLIYAALLCSSASAKRVEVVSDDFSGGQKYRISLEAPQDTKPSLGIAYRVEYGNVNLAFDTSSKATPLAWMDKKLVRTVMQPGFQALIYQDKAGLLYFNATVASSALKGVYIRCGHASDVFQKLTSMAELEGALKVCRSAVILGKA